MRFLVPDWGIRDIKSAMSRDILAGLNAAGIGIASGTYDIVGFPPVKVQLVGAAPAAGLIIPKRVLLLRVVVEHEEHFGLSARGKMSGQPHAAADRRLLQIELSSRLNLREKAFDGDRPNYDRVDVHPLKCVPIDPKLALHARQDLGSHVGRLIAGTRGCFQIPYVKAANRLLCR